MRKSTKNLVSTAVFLISLLVMGAGCSKTGSTLTTSPVTYLTFINEASYMAPITVLLNSTAATISGGVSAGDYSKKYGTVAPGSYDVQFEIASSDSLVSEIPTAVYDTLNFYTLILYKTTPGGPASSVRIWDDFSSISASQANYRFFNLSPDYPKVDLYLNSTKSQANRTIADNVSNTLYNSFQPVLDGDYSISVKVAGTDSTIATLSNVSLTTANAYTIFLGGNKGASNYPLQVNVLQASY